MTPPLLKAHDKQKFFAEMEAFVQTKTKPSSKARAPHVKTAPSSDHEHNDVIGETNTKPPPRQAKHPLSATHHTTKHVAHGMSASTKPEASMLTAPTEARAGHKRQLPMLGMVKTTKKAKRSTKFVENKQPLQGQGVLVVPLGRDMSRRRLEILCELVVALGGDVVDGATARNTTIQKANWTVKSVDKRSLLHLRHAVASVEKPSRNRSSKRIDVVIVSQQVTATQLQDYYRQFGIDHAGKTLIPEWLTRVRQENAIPSDSKEWEWHEQTVEMTSQETDTSLRDENDANDDQESDNDSGNVDGSDTRKASTREIVRAPPIVVDTEKIRKEEEELQRKKDELVRARIPIFHKLNPNFKVLSERQGSGKHVQSEKFVCQQSSMAQANFNAHLTDPLEELMEFLHVERDIWREYSYKKIVSGLKAMRTRVSSVRDLKGLWWAKGRMRDKVVEMLETGKLEKLEAKKNNLRLRALVEMSRIWGVGPATAAKLYNVGYRSLDDLRQRGMDALSYQQQIGLRYYDDILARMPRAEAQEIERIVTDEVHRLLPNATAFACGSFRRGKSTCGDVDVLITDPNSDECDILPKLLRRLRATGFLTDDLTHISDHHRMGHCDTYMGVCQVSKELPHRRIDIKVYPNRLFGFALLYFTGSDHFNRSMRLYARKKGWSLSDRYLKRVVRPQKGIKLEAGESVICPSEIDVFIALGLEYKDPTERNCFDIRFIEEDEAAAKCGGKVANKNAGEDDQVDNDGE